MQLWHGVILFLVLAGFGYTAFELQRTREWRRVDQELQDRMAMIFGPMRPPGAGPGRKAFRGEELGDERRGRREPREGRRELPDELPPLIDRNALEPTDLGAIYNIVWRRDGRVVRGGDVPDDVARPGPGDLPGVRMRGEFRELVRVTPRGDTILVGRSVAGESAELKKLALLLFGTGFGVLTLGLAGGWLVANRAIRPIESISATAHKIASGDLTQRIPQNETESELGRLVTVLNSTFTRLESAFAEQARFTTDVSHELRTPVAVIVSQTQMALARERSAAEYRETIEACQRAAQRMRGLIESLMQLARLDAGQESMKQEIFDLAKVAEDVIGLLRPLAEQRGQSLEGKTVSAQLRGDAERVSQVIVNLVTNAIHYTPAGGKVVVETSREDQLAVLKVSDTGVGIPAADLPKVFDRFYRVDQSRSREKGGSGLGLAITKAIVAAHGGTIEVSSTPGQGTTFIVRIPVAA
jgi:heavy metal sensor kinase